MTSIRVGIEASGLVASKPATGVTRYLAALVVNLARRAEENDLHLFLYFARPPKPHHYLSGSTLYLAPRGPRTTWRIAPMVRAWHWAGMGTAMLLDGLDVFHFPAPSMATFCPIPSVVTFHDLAAFSISKAQTEREHQYLPKAINAGKRAKAIIAVSQSASDEVQRFLQRSDATCIPEGVDTIQFAPAQPEAVTKLRQLLNVDRYILCVGTLQSRKNHLGLIDAFEQVADRIPHSLVIVGADGSGAEAVHLRLRDHPNPRIRLIGYADESLLPTLYSGAEALALPSFWEGFGLPLLEAMACGTPVLTSNTSSLVEVAGNAALIVDPADTNAIADGLYRLVTDHDLRMQLIEAGHARTAHYSWDNTARSTAEIYHRVAGR